MKRLIIISWIVLITVFLTADYLCAEIDPPHNEGWATLAQKQVKCNECHVARASATSGPSLTQGLTNFALCNNCHTSGMGAANLPFSAGEQANPNPAWGTVGGWSHGWERSMNVWTTPLWLSNSNSNNIFGLRTYEELESSSSELYWVHYKQGGAVCSVCHKQHYEAAVPWDPGKPAAWNTTGMSSGTAEGDSNTKVRDNDRAWITNMWTDSYVRINSGNSKGAVRQIKENDTTALTIYNTGVSTDPTARKSTFPVAIASGVSYTIVGKENHFLRMNNSENEMCVECHYYRDTNTNSDPASSRYSTWTGSKRSHPVGVIFSSEQGETPTSDAGRPAWTTIFNTAPLEPLSVFDTSTIARQTDTSGYYRYKNNGGWDTNSTNNVVLDSNGNIRCMSCHGVHYTDSDSSTVDQPD